MPFESLAIHMLSEDVAAVIVAGDLLKGEVAPAQPILNPEIGCREVAYLPPATSPADANGG